MLHFRICRNQGTLFDIVTIYAEAPTSPVPTPPFPGSRDRLVRSMVLAVLPHFRDLEELMAERGLQVDHSTIGRWVVRQRSTKRTSALLDAGTIYYRAVDSSGETIDFMLSPKRNRAAAKHFLQMALWRVGGLRPRVANVDGHPAYP
jgi:transposase-like protein